MRIYSAPSYVDIAGETFYDINLKQIGKDFWQAPREIQEAAFLPTSTANAGYFRQLVKYDVSAIKKTFSVVCSTAEATTLAAMDASEQTEWYVDNGTTLYRCMIAFGLAYRDGRATATLDISVLEAV